MCLDGVDPLRCQPCVGQCLPDDALLGRAVGGRHAAAGPVLVHGGAADDGQYVVSQPERVGQALHHEDSGALGPAGAVRARGEGLAAAVEGETALA